jgi:hypothetical protein
VGGRVGARKLPPALAAKAARVVRSAWDPLRFPWIRLDRPATATERDAAIRWTAGLWAVERVRTLRRASSSRSQESSVRGALQQAGWNEVERSAIRVLDDLSRGAYMREVRLAEEKCDIPIRLYDGRLLALECKVSNSAVNSYKRLNREVVDKAAKWRSAFGDQVVTGAVLGGVYKFDNLLAAQDEAHILLLWDHDLVPLVKFITAARV